jgi:hypothetical protein
MSFNDCTFVAFAVSLNLYLCSLPVYLTTFSQIRRLYDVEWGRMRQCLIATWQKVAVAYFTVHSQNIPGDRVQRTISVKRQARGQNRTRNYLQRNRSTATFCFSSYKNIRFLKNRIRFMRPQDSAYPSWLINRTIYLFALEVS